MIRTLRIAHRTHRYIVLHQGESPEFPGETSLVEMHEWQLYVLEQAVKCDSRAELRSRSCPDWNDRAMVQRGGRSAGW